MFRRYGKQSLLFPASLERNMISKVWCFSLKWKSLFWEEPTLLPVSAVHQPFHHGKCSKSAPTKLFQYRFSFISIIRYKFSFKLVTKWYFQKFCEGCILRVLSPRRDRASTSFPGSDRRSWSLHEQHSKVFTYLQKHCLLGYIQTSTRPHVV